MSDTVILPEKKSSLLILPVAEVTSRMPWGYRPSYDLCFQSDKLDNDGHTELAEQNANPSRQLVNPVTFLNFFFSLKVFNKKSKFCRNNCSKCILLKDNFGMSKNWPMFCCQKSISLSWNFSLSTDKISNDGKIPLGKRTCKIITILH